MAVIKLDKAVEQRIHDALKQEFLAMQEGEEPILDPDGEFAFTVVAFVKPSPEFADEFVKGGTEQDKSLAVGCSIINANPALIPDEEGQVSDGAALEAGMHALSTNILANLLREHVLGHVVGQSQEALVLWRSRRDD